MLTRTCQQSFAKLPPVTLRENPFLHCSITRTTEANRCVLQLLAVYTPKQNSQIKNALLSVALFIHILHVGSIGFGGRLVLALSLCPSSAQIF